MLAHADVFMSDIIRLYHATGARTHELLEALVGDFQPHSRTLVLGCHKRSRTMRDPIPRTITRRRPRASRVAIPDQCGSRGASSARTQARSRRAHWDPSRASS